ncbi:MAG: hypothetical protein J6K53_10640 [Roseburia sp.]|nr:hypothetical protein [Roseburia sp.]
MKKYKSSREIMLEMEKVIGEYQKQNCFSADFSMHCKNEIMELKVFIENYQKLEENVERLLIYIGSYTDQDISQHEVRDKFYEQVLSCQSYERVCTHKLYVIVQQMQEIEGITAEDLRILSWYENYIVSKSREIHQMLRSVWELITLNEDRVDITSRYM